ncbi:MAG: hypothetical protein IT350_11800 [Deltaproteobacteria bacterium]|nr:hypothetical protein [Deltaproteobacteria bacterium]
MNTQRSADVTNRQWRNATAVPLIAAAGLAVVPLLFRLAARNDFGELVAREILNAWPYLPLLASCVLWLAFRVVVLRFAGRFRFDSRLAFVPLGLAALGIETLAWIGVAFATAGAFVVSGLSGIARERSASRAVIAVAVGGSALVCAAIGVLSHDGAASLACAVMFAAIWVLRPDFRDLSAAILATLAVALLSALIPFPGRGFGAAQSVFAAASGTMCLMVVAMRSGRSGARYQVAMLLIAISGAVAIDRTMAAMDRPDESVENAAPPSTNRQHLFGRALAPGEWNDETWGWWIETGFFRMGAPTPKKSPGTTRILVQGASSTQGFGIERDEDVWTSVLERELNAREPSRKFDVVNAGLASTTSFTMLVNYREELRKYEHDVLLLYLGDNDATYSRGPLTEREMFDRMMSSAKPATGGNASMRLSRALGDSPMYRALRIAVSRVREAPGLPKGAAARVPAVPLGDFARNLREFHEIAQTRGARLVLVGEASRTDLHAYPDLMRSFADERGLVYVNANEAPRTCGIADEEFFLGQAHLSVAANSCLGQFLADAILRKNAFAEEGTP